MSHKFKIKLLNFRFSPICNHFANYLLVPAQVGKNAHKISKFKPLRGTGILSKPHDQIVLVLVN